MTTKSAKLSHHHLARLALLLLVVIPFIPEVIIFTVAALARLMGCVADQKEACLVGPLAVSDIIDWALLAGGVLIVSSTVWRTGFFLAISGWLVVCYVVLIQGWTRVASRLMLGLVVALFFAIMPLSGPMLAIQIVANENSCAPAHSGPCQIFGGKVEKAYAATVMTQSPRSDTSVELAAWIFVFYAILVIVLGVVSARRPVKAEQQGS